MWMLRQKVYNFTATKPTLRVFNLTPMMSSIQPQQHQVEVASIWLERPVQFRYDEAESKSLQFGYHKDKLECLQFGHDEDKSESLQFGHDEVKLERHIL